MNDVISRQAAVEAIENTDWYHLMDGVMVRGANSKEHQAWYKEQDIYKALEQLPSAQPEIVRCKDCKYWNDEFAKDKSTCWLPCMSMTTHREWHCGSAERRTDGIR